MMKMINTNQYKFLSQSPITILNKTSPCGAMRPVAYFSVEVPRTGSHLSDPMIKQTITYDGKDGNIKSFDKNNSSPCGDSFTKSVGYGLLEVPLHSVHDPDNVVAGQHHNLYLEENRKGRGAFSKSEEGIFGVINSWTDNKSGWKSLAVTSGNLFGGIDSKGDDILTPVYVDDGGDGGDGFDDDNMEGSVDGGRLSRTMTNVF